MDLSKLDFKNNYSRKRQNKKKIIIISLLLPIIVFLGFMLLKVSNVLMITGGSFNVGTYENFKVEKNPDRLNLLILGIRGAEDANGGLLADTMVLISFDKKEQKAVIVSIPRDLHVPIPNYPNPEKINFAYALGEKVQRGGGGLALSKEVVKYVTGLYVDYAIVVNFDGFEKLVNILGGVEIYRNNIFVEDRQWQGEGNPNSPYWHLEIIQNTNEGDDELTQELFEPDSTIDNKQDIKNTFDEKIEATQPEANETTEYWVFSVPSGYSVLNGEEALYYVRSRFSSSDFNRMVRQQEVISSMKAKAFSLGVIANPLKVFEILDTLGNNIKTDMKLGDIRELILISQNYSKIHIKTTLLENSEKGMLKEGFYNGQYILLPRDGDFTSIRNFFKNIFNEKT